MVFSFHGKPTTHTKTHTLICSAAPLILSDLIKLQILLILTHMLLLGCFVSTVTFVGHCSINTSSCTALYHAAQTLQDGHRFVDASINSQSGFSGTVSVRVTVSFCAITLLLNGTISLVWVMVWSMSVSNRFIYPPAAPDRRQHVQSYHQSTPKAGEER